MRLTKKPLHTYGSQIFSIAAPQTVLPLVFSLIQPRTVVDIGCGIGTWASVAKTLGCVVKGLDGPHVPVDQRLISAEEFVETDLTTFTGIGRFDLAICLEVVEHLPASHADPIVAGLCESADVILFSAVFPCKAARITSTSNGRRTGRKSSPLVASSCWMCSASVSGMNPGSTGGIGRTCFWFAAAAIAWLQRTSISKAIVIFTPSSFC